MSVLDDHDPLCRSYYRGLIPYDSCTDCALIRRVRADERERLQATQKAEETTQADHPTGTPF